MQHKINTLVLMEMEQFMGRSQQELALADETYQNDSKDEKELEERYESLDLTKRQKMLVNDYISCMKSAACRYSELSYMAGVRDTIRTFMRVGLLSSASVSVTKNNARYIML